MYNTHPLFHQRRVALPNGAISIPTLGPAHKDTNTAREQRALQVAAAASTTRSIGKAKRTHRFFGRPFHHRIPDVIDMMT